MKGRVWFALVPVVALLLLVWGINRVGFSLADTPPVEEITFEWTTLTPGKIKVDVINGGPDPVTIAQVSVDDAYWDFEIDPADGVLERLERGTITIPYHWVEGETHAIRLITRNGVTFDSEIPVALASPVRDSGTFWTFALMGILIGVIPVGLGLLWYPVLGGLSDRVLRFVLSLTVGLLVFLGFDTVVEGLEIAERLPDAFQGSALVFGAGLIVFFALNTLREASSRKHSSTPPLLIATFVALGIGLHNLGEGLAVGSAYVRGEVAFGATLIVGFMIHNVTEGLAIVAPAAREKLSLWTLVGLGALAGLPTIAGTLIGGFTYSNLWAVVFFGVAAGAIFQVVMAIVGSSVLRSEKEGLALPENFWGFVVGIAIMYSTGLMIAA